MKPIMLAGILLVVLGVLALVYQGFSYTRNKGVVDVGPIHATVDKKEHVPLPPILGGLMLATGVVLVFAGARK